MKKSIPVKPKRGRPATGRDPFVGIRLPPQLLVEIKKWSGQHDAASRSEAIRRLVELGLKVKAEGHSQPLPNPVKAAADRAMARSKAMKAKTK
jgi:Arc/MetJ-type ribon-helix-helix transcriptional regulator